MPEGSAERPGTGALSLSAREIALLLLVILLLAPFLGKAFTIDDPLFVWVGRHIHETPLNPYGFKSNWFGSAQWMWESNVQNPPLTSYWLSLAGLAGWGESWLHISMLPWTVLAVWGVARLARLSGADPFWAGLLTLGTPAFLVSSTNVMCDVMMLALVVWSVTLWVSGVEQRRGLLHVLSAMLAGLAALTKYFGVAIVPLLAAWSIACLVRSRGRDPLERRHILRWAPALLVPIAILAAWHFWSIRLYGASHVLGAAGYAAGLAQQQAGSPGPRLFAVFSFLGGCLFWPLVLSLWRGSAAERIGLAAVGVAGSLLFGGVVGQWSQGRIEPTGVLVVLAGLCCAAGAALLIRSALHLRWLWKDPKAWLLGLWILGTLVFVAFLNWTVAARNILPLVPPVAILAALPQPQRGAGTGPASRSRRAALLPAALFGLAVSVLAAWADYQWASGVKRAAAVIMGRYGADGRQVLFQGHWGFQYYMMELGAAPLEMTGHRLSGRDLVVIPFNNTNLNVADLAGWNRVEELQSPSPAGIYLTSRWAVAGFYSHVVGLLPLGYSEVVPDRYLVLSPPAPR